MSIDYALYANKLIADPNAYAARVQIKDSADLEQIADRIINQGSTVTKADILAVLENMCQACESFLVEGYRIRMGGVFELFPRIKGKFDGITDSFDPSRHKVEVGANPGSRIRKAVSEQATVAKQPTILPEPNPLEYVDLGTGEINNNVTPGSIGTINGAKLNIDFAVADEGVFFVKDDGIEVAVPQASIQKNMPSEQVFLIPALDTGDYHVEVRSHFSVDGELRVGRLDEQLTVTGIPSP